MTSDDIQALVDELAGPGDEAIPVAVAPDILRDVGRLSLVADEATRTCLDAFLHPQLRALLPSRATLLGAWRFAPPATEPANDLEQIVSARIAAGLQVAGACALWRGDAPETLRQAGRAGLEAWDADLANRTEIEAAAVQRATIARLAALGLASTAEDPACFGPLADCGLSVVQDHSAPAWVGLAARGWSNRQGVSSSWIERDRDGWRIEVRGRRFRVVAFDEGIDRVELPRSAIQTAERLVGVQLVRGGSEDADVVGPLVLVLLGEARIAVDDGSLEVRVSDFGEAGVLASLARSSARADATMPPAVLAEIVDALLELGTLAEAEPQRADACVMRLDAAQRAALVAAASRETALQLDWMHCALGELGDHPADLGRPSILADDPERAEASCAKAFETLAARESVHRLGLAVRLVANTDPNWDLEAVDRRLRVAVREWSALQVQRARAAETLPPQTATTHWWYTLSDDTEGDDDFDAAAAEAELAPVIGWLNTRGVHGEGRARLRLDREEALALLSTSAGQSLAHRLGDRLDLEAAFPTEAETAASLARVIASPALGDLGAWNQIEPAFAREPTSYDHAVPPERLAASTGLSAPMLLGGIALHQFDASAAFAHPDLGLVAMGHAACASVVGVEWTYLAMLVVPDPGVTAIRREAGEPAAGESSVEGWIARDRWSGGGLCFDLHGQHTLVFDVRRAGDESVERVRLRFESAPATPDALALVLRELAVGTIATARAMLAAILDRASPSTRDALEGLRLAMDPRLG